MTTETRQLLEVTDLEAISLRCRGCQTVVTWPITYALKVLEDCPHCGLALCAEQSDLRRPLLAFGQAVRDLLGVLTDKHPQLQIVLSVRRE